MMTQPESKQVIQKVRVAEMQKLYRILAYRLLGGYCSVCGSTNRLQIHHINKDWQDNRLENLQLLCSRHHGRKHRSVTLESVDLDLPYINRQSSSTDEWGNYEGHSRNVTNRRNYQKLLMRKRRLVQREKEGVTKQDAEVSV